MKLETGDTVDRYTVEEPLGTGGTAVVYRVRHKRLGTRHALKLLTISGESIKRRLLQEGKAQATLGHLNIVSVTDIVDIEGQPGLLMEYVDGPSLEEALLDYQLDLETAETLFLGVVSGVRAAHERGIIHRDLKPANVLLAPTEAGFVPKVTDFGLAKAVRGEPLREGATRQGVAMGTPSYMAPEQIRDAGKVDVRADVFSLGCMLYEIVSRHRAFPGEESIDIYDNVRAGRYIPIKQLVPDLPERFEFAIKGAMQIDKARRIPSCDVLLEVLKGERGWDLSEDPVSFPGLVPIPNIASDVPPLTLAPRDADGGTPMIAPERVKSAGSPFGNEGLFGGPDAETAEMDGTLISYDNLPAVDEGSDNMWAALLVVGSLGLLAVALLFALLGVGVLPVLLGAEEESASAAPVVDPTDAPATEDPATEVPAEAPVAESPPSEDLAEPGDPDPEAPVASEDPVDPPAAPEPTVPEPAAPAAVPAPSPEPAAPTPEPAVPAGPITVKFFSDVMSAGIYIDGKPVRRRTPSPVALTPGRHTVRIDSGAQSGHFTIDVGPTKAKAWCYRFETGTAQVGRCP